MIVVVPMVMPDPPAAPNGPTVEPLMRAYIPREVVQTSPLLGEVGAVPCGKFKPAEPVVEAAVTSSPGNVNGKVSSVPGTVVVVGWAKAEKVDPRNKTRAVIFFMG